MRYPLAGWFRGEQPSSYAGHADFVERRFAHKDKRIDVGDRAQYGVITAITLRLFQLEEKN